MDQRKNTILRLELSILEIYQNKAKTLNLEHSAGLAGMVEKSLQNANFNISSRPMLE